MGTVASGPVARGIGESGMSDPFKIDSPTCISFSGGRTSAYMLWRVLQSNGGLPACAKVLFANTGKEDEASLRFVRDCGARWGVEITWLELCVTKIPYANAFDAMAMDGPYEVITYKVVDFKSASRTGKPFEDVISMRASLPNPAARYCSSEMKTRTMHRYIRDNGIFDEWDSFIGIRADEITRVRKFRNNPHPETKDETVILPLADAGVTLAEVNAFWGSQDFRLDLPTINGKTVHGNCDLCFLKNAGLVQSLISEEPQRAVWWDRMERESKADTLNGRRFRIDRPSYGQMIRAALTQTDYIGFPDSSVDDSIACYCGE